LIRLRGVRTHNLRGVDLDLPAGRWVALCGVSGSGKSSLAIHTLHAEAERRWISTLAVAHRLLGEGLPRPDLDSATGLPPTAVLLQDPPAHGARATVATLAGLQAPLAALWAAFAECRSPVTGKPMRSTTVSQAAEDVLRAAPGARLQVLFAAAAQERDPATWIRKGFVRARLGDGTTVELESLPPEADRQSLHLVVDRLVAEDRHRSRLQEAIEAAWKHGEGVCAIEAFPRDGSPVLWLPASSAPLCLESGLKAPRATASLFSRSSPRGWCPTCVGVPSAAPCPACRGTGLREEASWFHLGPLALTSLWSLEGSEALEAAEGAPLEVLRGGPGGELVDEIRHRLRCLVRLGLGYLPLDRSASSLSMGEERRCRLAGLLGAPLTGLAWILDEPSTGLHPRDLPALHGLLRDLVDDGATLLTIEHDLTSLERSDHVVETGPGPGRHGGLIVASTAPEGLASLSTPSGDWLSGRFRPPPGKTREAWGSVRLTGARGRNLRDLDLEIPLGRLVGVSGVSGAGKSSLLLDTLAPALASRLGQKSSEPLPFGTLEIEGPLAAVEVVSGHGEAVRNSRSIVASLCGLLDPLRELFASLPASKERGWTSARFSPNVKGGRCEPCEGLGHLRLELHLLPDAWTPCPHCDGRRFAASTLEVRWKGLDFGEVLDLDLETLAPLAANHPKLGPLLERLVQVGLGHLSAGRRSSTLSGGELLRLRLMATLGTGPSRTRQLWLLDEPSRGLHPQDVARLLAAFERLLDAGHAVVAITHDPFLLSRSQHVLELGPGAGREGGRILYSGNPTGLASSDLPSSEALARELST
jgi:excinuclease ABC subunit A